MPQLLKEAGATRMERYIVQRQDVGADDGIHHSYKLCSFNNQTIEI